MRGRLGNFLGFAACVALLGYAYFAQYFLHLEPCPLCIFQRVGVFAVGVVFLIAALHDPVAWGRRVYAVLIGLAALAALAVAAKHLYIQSLPPDAVPSCGASLAYMMKIFSVGEVITKVLTGSGECAKITWRFLGLSMPGWVLIAAVGLLVWGLWINLRRQRPILRF